MDEADAIGTLDEAAQLALTKQNERELKLRVLVRQHGESAEAWAQTAAAFGGEMSVRDARDAFKRSEHGRLRKLFESGLHRVGVDALVAAAREDPERRDRSSREEKKEIVAARLAWPTNALLAQLVAPQQRISIIAKIVSGKDLPSMDRSLFKRAKSDPYVQLWYRDVSAAVREDAAAAGAAAAQEGAASGGRNGSWRARRRFGRRNSSNWDKKKDKEKSSRLSMAIGHDAAVELRENIAKAAAASDASDLFSGAEASAMSGAKELGMPWSGKKEERASMVRKRPVYLLYLVLVY